MKALFLALGICLVVVAQTPTAQEPAAVESRIESIGLFKNGLALVQRTVQVPRSGPVRIDDLPVTVHGTFWITSAVPIEASLVWREAQGAPTHADITRDQLVGKNVVAHFRDGSIAPVAGRVIVSRSAVPRAGEMLILETAGGLSYIDSGMIAHLAVEGATVRRQESTLILSAGNRSDATASQPIAVSISYLTRGLSWAPAYRVSLDDGKMLTVQQQAVIRNEMGPFRDAELHLISGFPSVQFAHVQSPFSIQTSWATFFNQLGTRIVPNRGLQTTLSQVSSPVSDPGVDLSGLPAGEGVDLHYHSIGRRSMQTGEALMLSTGEGRASYERVVEWRIADDRDEYGRPLNPSRAGVERDVDQDAPWDAVRFKNPLPFPMTTGPAMITSAGRFSGQRQTAWVNRGEDTTLQITRSLSVRTRHVEQEDPDKVRQIVQVGGRAYRRVPVKGQLDISNHRQEAITLVIRRQFSGDLIVADDKPTVTLAEAGVYSVNPRNQLNWTLTIGPGASRTVTYQYSVLVLN